MIDLAAASDYLRLFRGKVFVIKVGGACLERPGLVAELARQIAVVDACGAHPVVVHGAGPQVDAVQRRRGEEPIKVAGRRVTSDIALAALAEVTREEIGPLLAEQLRRFGAEPRLVPAEEVAFAARRAPVMVDGETVDFQNVGDLQRVDGAPVRALCADGVIPVLSPPVADVEAPGSLLNANADLLAAAIAVACEAEKLMLLTSAQGVLADPADPRSALSTSTLAELAGLEEEGVIQGGMRVKARAARDAIEGGVPRVHVVSGVEPEALLGELFTTHGTGTLVTREPESAP